MDRTSTGNGENLMIDHMTFRVSDLARTKELYTAALAPLGYKLAFEFSGAETGFIGFGYPDVNVPNGMKIDTWFADGPSPYGGHLITTGCHLCWQAPNRVAVDAFYKAAIEQGAKDNGPPGLRPMYHPNYYGAFVIDHDGNNVEACCHY